MVDTKFASLLGRLPVSASNPSNPVAGDEYYNSRTNSWMRYDGSQWWGARVTTTSTSTTTTSTSTTTTSTSTTTTTSTSTSTTSSTTSTSTTITTTSTSTTTTV